MLFDVKRGVLALFPYSFIYLTEVDFCHLNKLVHIMTASALNKSSEYPILTLF